MCAALLGGVTGSADESVPVPEERDVVDDAKPEVKRDADVRDVCDSTGAVEGTPSWFCFSSRGVSRS